MQGVSLIARDVGLIRAQSRFYQTPAFPPGNGADYINAVIAVETTLLPDALMRALHAIEARMGRARQKRWGSRTLDLDLLAFGDLLLPDAKTHAEWRGMPLQEQMRLAPDTLILPHPRLQDRPFVLVPLADVAPDWVHPALGKTIQELLQAQSAESLAEVRALSEGEH